MGRRGTSEQVRLVTSWMISAGPDARARPALTPDAYVSTGATRIRAVGACPSRLLPPVPLFIFSAPLLSLFTPRPVKHLYLFGPEYNPRANADVSPGLLSFAKPPAKTMLPLFMRAMFAPKEAGVEDRRRGKKKRKVRERTTAFTSPGCMHTKLCRGESNLPTVASIGDFRTDDAHAHAIRYEAASRGAPIRRTERENIFFPSRREK